MKVLGLFLIDILNGILPICLKAVDVDLKVARKEASEYNIETLEKVELYVK